MNRSQFQGNKEEALSARKREHGPSKEEGLALHFGRDSQATFPGGAKSKRQCDNGKAI
jgi:hypothetical protein